MASASEKQAFIENIAVIVQKYAPQYNIAVCSPIIAQACKESAFGTSELALRAFNYFGLKFKTNRCPSALAYPYYKDGSEQNPDGSYTTSAMQWFQFANMDACVKGYFDFINIARYSNLKNVTDPKTYCDLIKEDGYATSLTYATSLYNDYIVKYDLQKYDKKGETMTTYKVAINAGHWNGNAKGVPSSMPILGGTREFTLNERVVSKVVELLKPYPNIEVMLNYDPTGNSKIELEQRVSQANKAKVNLYLSVHHNGGINGGDGGGTVVYYYQGNTKNKNQATKLYNEIKSRTGLKGNRSNPICGTRNLYEINASYMDAFLIECAFMDSRTDVYYIARDTWAQSVASGIVAFILSESGTPANGTPAVNTPSVAPVSMAVNYRIKVYQPINVYSDANKGKVNMVVKSGVYTIVEERGNMGLLKSKAGWIDLGTVNKL